MAIDATDLAVLFRANAGCRFEGTLLTLGRQDVTVSPAELRSIAARCGFPLAEPVPDGGLLSDQALFHALGFTEVQSLDADGYEGARIIHDLNDPDPPAGTAGRFDVVLDRGVSDMVFDLPASLACLARMVVVGGRVIHFLPSSNHIETGYVMLSPCVLRAFYEGNGFALETLWLVRHPWLNRWPTAEVYDYLAGGADPLRGIRLDDRAYQVLCVSRRLSKSTYSAVPRFREGADRIAKSGGIASRLPRILSFSR
jgi:hypothetical protein